MAEPISNTVPFKIDLKQNDLRVFNTIAALVLILSYLCFSYKAIMLQSMADIIIVVLLASVLGIAYFNVNRGRIGYKYGILIFLLTGAIWFFQGSIAGFAIGLLVMAAGYFQMQLKETPTVVAADSGITVKNVFSKHYAWGELNNVIIKDGLLTVDCKNNRILQKETSLDITAQYEAKFNEFCVLKIHGR